LYCGTGGIGISIASQCDRLVGVDSNKEAIDDARYNAALNGLTNTEFVAQETEDFLDKLDASKLTVQLSGVVVDPPRPGLHPKALTTLIELNPPAIAYVSCNPESLARDLSRLAPLYHIRSVQVFDLFPHTHHVETLVTLEHR
jgi:23S rRNA (uracil1939-C5)-methyltransferase